MEAVGVNSVVAILLLVLKEQGSWKIASVGAC